jgi:hypothetical protein
MCLKQPILSFGVSKVPRLGHFGGDFKGGLENIHARD